MNDEIKSFTVIKDIEPYVSQATGEVINSRSRHREHLKERGLIEVGNENLTAHAQKIREKRDKESNNFNKKVTEEFVRHYDTNREYRSGEWRAIAERIRSDIHKQRSR